jgi:thioredoxin 1
MAGNVLEFTDANFQGEVLDSQQPVLVDFWAPWCGPCKMLAPTIEELASEFEGRARVGKLNTDDNPQVASNYGISAIPTVMVFKGGTIVDRFVGVTPKAKMSAALSSHL